MSQIRMTPQELYDGEKYTLQLAGEIQTELKALNDRIQQIVSTWEGQSQSSFVVSFNELYNSFMSRFPETIENVAKAMHSAAKHVEESDRDLAQKLRG